MSQKINSAFKNRQHGTELAVSLGITAVFIFFLASGIISYLNIRILNRNIALVSHTHEVIIALDDLLSLMKDAETGQRGYLLTGEEKYLAPYISARARLYQRINSIENLTADNKSQQAHIPKVKEQIRVKLDELANTITVRRNQGLEPARKIVLKDMGRATMATLRSELTTMREEEQRLRQLRIAERNNAYRTAIVSGVLTGLLGVFLSLVVAFLIRRAEIIRRRQEWLQNGRVKLSEVIYGEQRIDQLGENILKFLAEYFDAHAGLFFIKSGDGYTRVASYGLPVESNTIENFEINDGLLGQAVKDDKTFLVNNVPDGYMTVGSALGYGNPRHLIISPASSDGSVNAVFELGFIHPVNDQALDLLESVSETISIAVRSSNYRAHLQNLLEETQRQAEELQAQSEELRVSNEELEEQSRALKESQSRLEQQQAELEQTNSQLEEQAQLLEVQKDDLSRTKASVELKAQELEQASQYKSDFLANMSHELRTPLNSSLIMAKLLADNPGGNLSDEQVKYAETIQSSGNDLLALINDILDLSKIEAGYMEILPEQIHVSRLVTDLTRLFEPVAKQKGLKFSTVVEKGCPDILDTDRQRLEQVIKNLLSNAIKFTEKGSVNLSVSKTKDGQISFTVKDTGIGISEDQQHAIFDAFRQADGTISRKYGGTGLGLSISRELARLLGGSITLESTLGKGSTFAIIIPETYDATSVRSRAAANIPVREDSNIVEPAKAKVSNSNPARKAAQVHDDRELLTSNSRVLLIVEDDESFARIFYDLAHELGFQCLISSTADDALVVAKQYLPSAIVLDMGLPDHSGLSVLDRLKRDGRTRHIPVHVVSANDHTQTAMSLGAVGYMLKPVKRDELSDAIKKLELKLDQRLRRVLIVEDDTVQRESVRTLLGSRDVETVGVGTAAECLEKLKETTFDCMVLDLTLPDASGYSLLEKLSQEDTYSFPPVIVYTGRDLPADEEQKLRRYSKSIIIKGVKSPERLLDEVTLFLHQVESELPPEQQRMLEQARNRDAILEGRRILIVEDDVRNVYSLTSILEPRGAVVQIARNGREALEILDKENANASTAIDLILMDVMMPEMDGLTATREIRKRDEWKKLPVIMLTAKAMKDDQERCLEAGANDYMAKPLDVEKLLSLVRVWMPR